MESGQSVKYVQMYCRGCDGRSCGSCNSRLGHHMNTCVVPLDSSEAALSCRINRFSIALCAEELWSVKVIHLQLLAQSRAASDFGLLMCGNLNRNKLSIEVDCRTAFSYTSC